MAKGKGNPGAGRPAGSKNKRTLAAEAMRERILAEGQSPLEVMIDGMRAALKRGAAIEKELAAFKIDANTDTDRIKALAELQAEGRRYIMAAHECAKDAAPYLHPKLANVTVEGSIAHSWEDVLSQLDDSESKALEWTDQTNSTHH